MPKKLAEYAKKRRFDITSEPSGREKVAHGEAPIFVVQKHHASHLHYDFRLELDGTLKSWAVPKGPSLDPKVKRLAVEVEDHPVAYAKFEGVIPEGQYGAGHVAIWDHGTWKPLGDARAALAKGKLEFTLAGEKLHGAFKLVRMQSPKDKGKKPQWLLIKAEDDHAAARPEETRGQRRALPPALTPELATLVDRAPEGDDWAYEIKLDGYRMLARVEHGKAKLVSRNGNDYTKKLPRVAKALEALGVDDTVIDGEIVVFDEHGISRFQALQNALDGTDRGDVRFVVFDLLFVGGKDLRERPLVARRDALRTLVASDETGRLAFSESLEGDPRALLAAAKQTGVEGLIGKRKDAPYRSGRGRQWIKLKWKARQELVIVGYTKPRGSRSGFGALLLAVREGDTLRYAGRVGAGFDESSLASVHAALRKRHVAGLALDDAPTGYEAKGVTWVRPELVAEVEFAEWTAGGHVRQGVFLGLREDKPAEEIVKETPVRLRAGKSSAGEIAGVVVSSPTRVLEKKSGVTKRALAEYYAAVAEWMLPHLAGRPVSLVRAPDGVGKAQFFQKHAAPRVIPGVRLMAEGLDPGHPALLAIDTPHALVGAVQMGTIELHTWNATERALETPDRVIFDLDPGEGVTWPQVIEAAELVKVLLDELGLTSFLKTTGGRGLHVVVPLTPRDGWDEVKDFSEKVARHLARLVPEKLVATSGPKNRVGRIFIDYLRNGRGASTVAAYSARAREGMGVSTPLAWKELRRIEGPEAFDVRTVPSRLARMKEDPWRGYADVRQTVGGLADRFLGERGDDDAEEDTVTEKKKTRRTAAKKAPKKAAKRAPKKVGARKYGAKAQEKVEETMHELKRGTLRSSSGQRVKSRKQAIAIGLSEARRAGGKVPPPKRKG